MNPGSLIEAFKLLVGAENVLTGSAAEPYCQDQRGVYSGQATAVIFPGDTQQVSSLLCYCHANNISIVPQGGNTSLCGASVPIQLSGLATHFSQVIINLSRMSAIRTFDAENYTMTVDAGCTLAQIREAAALGNRLFPLSLTAIDTRCEIGGNLSTNAGGMGVLRYGNMRDLVLGLEVVLPDGRIWNGLRSLRKDNTGYDLKHLFVGAEGTLGIITAAVLKLFPLPISQASACVAIRDPAMAVSLLAHLRSSCGDRISAFEIISRTSLDLVCKHFPEVHEPFEQPHKWIVLTELTDVVNMPLDVALQNALGSFSGGIDEYLVSSNQPQTSLWWPLRKLISDAQKREGISIKHDVSVSISKVPDFIQMADTALKNAYPGIRIVSFGHIGDGNIHYNASMPDRDQNTHFIAQQSTVNRIVYDIVSGLNGSISAEHGLGQLKRQEIHHYKNALELELMARIKQVIDPNGLMNPGKFI